MRDTRNQGLRVTLVALGVPVARSRVWRNFSGSCYPSILTPDHPAGLCGVGPQILPGMRPLSMVGSQGLIHYPSSES